MRVCIRRSFGNKLFLIKINMLTNRVTAGRPNRILIMGRRHPGNFFEQIGKIVDGGITQRPGGVCQIHFVLADQLFGGPDPHLAEVFDGAQSGLLPEYPL